MDIWKSRRGACACMSLLFRLLTRVSCSAAKQRQLGRRKRGERSRAWLHTKNSLKWMVIKCKIWYFNVLCIAFCNLSFAIMGIGATFEHFISTPRILCGWCFFCWVHCRAAAYLLRVDTLPLSSWKSECTTAYFMDTMDNLLCVIW